MCGRQLNSSSNAKVSVLMNLFNVTVFKTKAKLMFLPRTLEASSILFVFAGCKMALLSPQSDASFMLLCSSSL